MFDILNGRDVFYQWDINQKITVEDNCNQVHFCNGTTECSYVVTPYVFQEVRIVDVPNILLQDTKNITAFAYCSGKGGQYTSYKKVFSVLPKTKPEDYVYKDTEVLTWDSLDERIKYLESNGGSGGGGGGNWRLIRTVVVPEDVTTDESGITWVVDSSNAVKGFQFDTDENGEKYAANEMLIEMEVQNGSGSGNLNIQNDAYPIAFVTSATSTSMRRTRVRIQKEGNLWVPIWSYSNYYNVDTRSNLYTTGFLGYHATANEVPLINNLRMGYTGATVMPGSIFRIYVR